MNNNQPSEKLWSIGFVNLLMVNIVNHTASAMIMPLIPGYIVSMGSTLSFAGAVIGILPFIALAARPLASVLGDNFNKKLLLVISMSLTGFSVVLYALVPDIMWLVPVRVLHGVVFSISGTVGMSLGASFVPEKRIGEGVGYLGFGHIFGTALGPNIGIFLMKSHTYEFCFMLSGIAIMTAGLSVLALRYKEPVPVSPAGRGKRIFSFRNMIATELLPNAFFAGILSICNGVINSYLVLLGKERDIPGIGLYFIVNSLVLLAMRPLFGRMTDRKGVAYAVIPGFLLAAGAMGMLAMSHTLWMAIIAAVLAAGGGSAIPTIQADCLKKLDSGRKTVATGTYFIGVDSGICVGQIFGGVLFDTVGFSATYSGVGIFLLAGLGLYLLYIKFEKRRKV